MSDARCPECGIRLENPWAERCAHRRACQARVMLANGVPVEVAAAHAQRLTEREERHA